MMTPETVMTIGTQALQVTVMLAAPMLVMALAVGLMVGVFQAATQINEMTLSFIPKLVAMALTIALAGPWMLKLITGYTRSLFESIPGLIG
jgi:flagellar biosynthetic protein FliQ